MYKLNLEDRVTLTRAIVSLLEQRDAISGLQAVSTGLYQMKVLSPSAMRL